MAKKIEAPTKTSSTSSGDITASLNQLTIQDTHLMKANPELTLTEVREIIAKAKKAEINDRPAKLIGRTLTSITIEIPSGLDTDPLTISLIAENNNLLAILDWPRGGSSGGGAGSDAGTSTGDGGEQATIESATKKE